jgi:hypothetical protein
MFKFFFNSVICSFVLISILFLFFSIFSDFTVELSSEYYLHYMIDSNNVHKNFLRILLAIAQ